MSGGSGQITLLEDTLQQGEQRAQYEGMADITVPDGFICGQVNSLTRYHRAGVLSFLPFFNI